MVHAQFLDRIADVALGRVESLVVPGEMPDDWPDALAHLERSPVRRVARSTMLMRDGAIGSRMPVIARRRGRDSVRRVQIPCGEAQPATGNTPGKASSASGFLPEGTSLSRRGSGSVSVGAGLPTAIIASTANSSGTWSTTRAAS